MTVLRWIYRLLAILLHVLWGVLLIAFFLGPDPERRTEKDWQYIHNWMQRLCRILGLRLVIEGKPVKGPALFVSNHISWHDIPALQSIIPTGFVAKSEIRGWPLIGWMAYRGNTLFIKRGKRDSFLEVKQTMHRRLRSQNLLIFPEGTTSTGVGVLPFRTRLYEPAIDENVPIQAIALHYRSPNKTCAELAFVNNETFIGHTLRLLAEPYIEVYIRFCRPLHPAEHDRKNLGEITHSQVAEKLQMETAEPHLN